MKDVKEWIKNPDYDTGLKLYERYGTNSFFKSLFASGCTPYNSEKLKEELTNLVHTDDQEVNNTPDIPIPPKSDNTFLLRKLDYELQQIHRAIDNNMFQLRRGTSDKTRREYALQILKLQAKKFAKYKERDYLEEHGCLPPIKPKAEYTTPEIQRLYVQIYKTKKRLEKPELRNRAKTENLLHDQESKLQQLLSERI